MPFLSLSGLVRRVATVGIGWGSPSLTSSPHNTRMHSGGAQHSLPWMVCSVIPLGTLFRLGVFGGFALDTNIWLAFVWVILTDFTSQHVLLVVAVSGRGCLGLVP